MASLSKGHRSSAANAMANKSTTITSNGLQDPEVVIAIDIGSTNSRAVIAWPEDGNIQVQVIENRDDKDLSHDGMAQFSSRILPFDDDAKKYIGNAFQKKREESSIKFMPYALLGTTEEMEKQYPVLLQLWEKRNKPDFNEVLFIDRIENAFTQFLHFIFRAVKKAVDVRKFNDLHIQIKTIALTVPSQWDLDFHDLYERLVKDAFQKVFADMAQVVARNIDVVFHTEALALAQYIFHQCSSAKEVALKGGMPNIDELMNKANVQCLIDCGGHNANSTLTTFHRNKDGKAVLYEIGQSKGAGGGMEMWLHDMLMQIHEHYLENYPDSDEMTLELKQAFKQDIKEKTLRLLKGSSHFITELRPQTGDLVSLEIDEVMDKKAFQTAFEYVKIMIREHLERLASIKQGWGSKEHEVTIVLSGGSSLHPEFVKWTQALCVELKLPEAVFAHHMEIQYGPARIAKGAAYATLTHESVASFAEKCAFGLQKGKVTMPGEVDEHLQLRQSADTVWYKERGAINVTFNAEGDGAEYRIICQPFLESFTTNLQTDESMAEGASYDFLNLGTLPGDFQTRIEFDFDIEKQQVSLRVVLIPVIAVVPSDFSLRRSARQERKIDLGPFDVRVQPGTLCLLIQRPTEEIDEHIEEKLGRFRPTSAVESKAEHNTSYRQQIPGRTRQPKSFPAPANAAPKTAAVKNKSSAPKTSTSTNRTSSSANMVTASAEPSTTCNQAPVARNSASNVPFGRASGRQTVVPEASGAPSGTRTSSIDIRSDKDMMHRPGSNASSSSREASSSTTMTSAFGSPAARGSAAMGGKRPAPLETGTDHMAKRRRADSGLFCSPNSSPSQDASPPVAGRHQSAAFSGRQRSTASDTRSVHMAGRNDTDGEGSSRITRPPARDTSSLVITGSQGSGLADREHPDASATRPRHTMRRNPRHNVSFSGPRPIDVAGLRNLHIDTAARANSPAGTAPAGAHPVDTRRPAYGPLSVRNTPAQAFSGHRSADRGPPKSD